MSTDGATVEAGDDRVDDLIPDDFAESWGCENAKQAIKIAERAPSSTAYDEMKRCPECGAVRIRPKTAGWKDIPHKKESQYKCATCFAHFDTPAPPIARIREELPNQLERAADHAARLAAFLGGRKK